MRRSAPPRAPRRSFACPAIIATLTITSLTVAAPARAQYPLVPSPVLERGSLSTSVDVGGYVAVRGAVRNDSSAFTIERARLSAMVAPLPYAIIRVQGELASSATARVGADSTVHGFALTDAYLQLKARDDHPVLGSLVPALIVGQFKQPFSLEYLTSFAQLLTANRSMAVDQLAPKRDIGAMGQVSWGRYVTVMGSVVNGQGANVTTNPDGREMVAGRLTVVPVPELAVAGKLANQGADHLSGYDGRWIWRNLIVEGEHVHRTHPLENGTQIDAGGGYVAAAYRLLPWFQPVFKQEWFTQTATSAGGSVDQSNRWSTIGVNVLTPRDLVRVEIDWVAKHEHPVSLHDNELDVQLIAIF